jgi:hypothetical protein
MGHRLRRSLGVARQGIEAQSDAGREDEAVEGERGSVAEPDAPRGCVVSVA